MDEIYRRSQGVLKLLADLPINEQQIILFLALETSRHNALMEELEQCPQDPESATA